MQLNSVTNGNKIVCSSALGMIFVTLFAIMLDQGYSHKTLTPHHADPLHSMS